MAVLAMAVLTMNAFTKAALTMAALTMVHLQAGGHRRRVGVGVGHARELYSNSGVSNL